MNVWLSLGRKMKGLMLRHGPMMITCAEFETFVMDYLSGDLPPGKKRVFDLHLKICRECREYLAAYKQTVALGKAAFEESADPLPGDVPEDLVTAILAARSAND